MSDTTLSDAEKPLFQNGDCFHGYELERPLGKGGLGTVWLVRHRMLDTLFALKTLDPKVAEERPEFVKRFVREAKIASKIRHPNLVAVHDAGYDAEKNVYYLVMDYVAGGTVRDAIAFGGIRSEKEAVNIVLQVASALAAARHFGLVHRDIKPENIMLTPDGMAKLVDLGVAKVTDGSDSLKTTANSVFGTPSYISPEQALDSSTVDTRADIYSLGIVLFEMLCGKRPYEGETPLAVMQKLLDPAPIPDVRTFNPSVSSELSAVLPLMCAKKAEDRIASPEKLLETFARIGYVLPGAPVTEFAATPEPDVAPVVLPDVASGTANSTLSFETKDKEIQDFVEQLKLKRRRKVLVRIALAVAALLILAVVVGLAVWH